MLPHTVTFALRDGTPSAAVVYEPVRPQEIVVIHIPGGAFSSGGKEDGHSMASFISATLNCVVCSIDFRKDKWYAHTDIADAIQALRRPGWKCVLSGSSSGGWFALNQDSRDLSGIILWCPVVAPTERMRWLEAASMGVAAVVTPNPSIHKKIFAPAPDKARKIMALQKAYFAEGEHTGIRLPECKSLMIAGGRDENVPAYILTAIMSHVTTTVVFGEGTHALQQAKFTDSQRATIERALAEFVA